MATMDDLTTGQVAGIIAAGVFAVNILFKLIWPMIMVALMNMNDTAGSWTRVAAHIQGSLWATFLRSDSTTSTSVKMSLRFTSKMGTLSTLFLSLASIITPLGLYESIAAGKGQEDVEFFYAKDASVFGAGTLPRPAEGLSRLCGGVLGPAACPYSGSIIESTRNSTGIVVSDQDVISVDIDPNYMAYLSSGAAANGPMVSSMFDIEYRTYNYKTDVRQGTANEGQKYVVGSFNQFDTLFLREDYHIIEGLIVDTKTGSIGFRNHSIPITSQWGAAWTEDLLFIEPKTECVNTNLTFEWTVPMNTSSSEVVDLVLVDNGGFINMNDTFPELDTTDAQEDPQLAYRAYRSAWLQNAYTALYYNVTNPGTSISGMKAFSYMDTELGRQIPMVKQNASGQASVWLNKRFSVGEFGGFIDELPSSPLSNTSTSFRLNVPENPWQITSRNFSEARTACNALFPSTRANTSNILSYCGAALGIPQEKGGSQNIVRFEPGTSYTQPLFGCASVMRAVIKRVSFVHNGTGLAGLSITNIREKEYEDESSWPLWGVESSDLRLDDGAPFWGIIAKDQRDQFLNMTFVEKPDFYLPGYISTFNPGSVAVITGQNLAGADFYSDALAFAYSVGSSGSDVSFDYSGGNNLGVYNKWADMSTSGEGIAKIINLIWTDAAANSVVGTKSWLPKPNVLARRQDAGNAPQALVPVHRFTRRVRYHLAYAIPAVIVLAIFAIALCLSFIMAIFGDASPGRLRVFLMKTSVGRVMTSLLQSDQVTAGAPPKLWAERLGRMHIDYAGAVPRGAAAGQHPGAQRFEVYDPMLVKGSSSIGLQELKAR